MMSPRLCRLVVKGLVFMRMGHIGWQVPAVEDPPASGSTMKTLSCCCGRANLLSLLGEIYPDVLTQGWTHRQAEIIARWGQACSVRGRSVCAHVYVGFWCGRTTKSRDGVGVVGGAPCADGVCLLNRCFRVVCLSWGCDMVSQGQSRDRKEDICCIACCFSLPDHPRMVNLNLDTIWKEESSPIY